MDFPLFSFTLLVVRSAWSTTWAKDQMMQRALLSRHKAQLILSKIIEYSYLTMLTRIYTCMKHEKLAPSQTFGKFGLFVGHVRWHTSGVFHCSWKHLKRLFFLVQWRRKYFVTYPWKRCLLPGVSEPVFLKNNSCHKPRCKIAPDSLTASSWSVLSQQWCTLDLQHKSVERPLQRQGSIQSSSHSAWKPELRHSSEGLSTINSEPSVGIRQLSGHKGGGSRFPEPHRGQLFKN